MNLSPRVDRDEILNIVSEYQRSPPRSLTMSLLCEEYVLSDNNSSTTSNSTATSESEPDMNRARPDPHLAKDPRVMDNMLLLEKSTIPHCDYFATVQTDIKPFMRKLVTIWMLELCDEQRVEEQVFPLAINFMDRFLCVCNISRQQLQLLGATCLLVAAKIRQCHSLPVDLLCAYTDCTITPEQVKVRIAAILGFYDRSRSSE